MEKLSLCFTNSNHHKQAKEALHMYVAPKENYVRKGVKVHWCETSPKGEFLT